MYAQLISVKSIVKKQWVIITGEGNAIHSMQPWVVGQSSSVLNQLNINMYMMTCSVFYSISYLRFSIIKSQDF